MEDFKMYDSIDIARHLMALLQKNRSHDICNTKINKLLYCIYGIYLAAYDKEVLTEQPKYFPYGPVFPRVLNKYEELIPIEIILEKKLNDVINLVITTFGKKSASELSTWSHRENSPWYKMKERNSKYTEALNPIEVRDYFKKFILNNEK